MKVSRLTAITSTLLATTISCFLLVSCFGPGAPPDGYLAVDATNVYFIQFTEKNNQVNGNLRVVEETNDTPPQTKSFAITFTGTQSGTSITLTFSLFFFSSSITGTLNGTVLTLDIPQSDGHLQSETFNGVSIQQYNQAVDALQKKVSQEDQQYNNSQATATTLHYNDQATATTIQATQAAQQSEQQAVRDANSQLSSDLATLKDDQNTLAAFSESDTLTSYQKDWQQMQSDYATEQKDAQAGCGANSSNLYQVNSDDYQINSDEYQIHSDDYQFNSDKNQYTVDLTPVQKDIQTVQNDWTQLQQAAASNSTGIPVAAYSANDIDTMLQKAQAVVKNAQDAWQAAQSQVTQYDQEASALQQQAGNIPASMQCA